MSEPTVSANLEGVRARTRGDRPKCPGFQYEIPKVPRHLTKSPPRLAGPRSFEKPPIREASGRFQCESEILEIGSEFHTGHVTPETVPRHHSTETFDKIPVSISDFLIWYQLEEIHQISHNLRPRIYISFSLFCL